jgi:hypothetical protein
MPLIYLKEYVSFSNLYNNLFKESFFQPPMACDFTYEHYREILEAGKEKYEFRLFKEEKKDRSILMRHDVDFDLRGAQKLSEIEKSLDVRSTYFIFLQSPFYNSLEQENKEVLFSILDNGHEIGLHADPHSTNDVKNSVKTEAKILKKIIGERIRTVSFHRPKNYADGKTDIGEFLDAYSLKHQGFEYFSDSNMELKNGCLNDVFNSNEYNRIQVLTHPIWWKQFSRTRDERIDRFLEGQNQNLIQKAKENVRGYKNGE